MKIKITIHIIKNFQLFDPIVRLVIFVVPIHKGGARSSPANFRPVSLTSHIIKMERVIRPVNTFEDVEALQDDLNKLYQWQETNNMAFNSNKFEVLRYGWNQELKNSTEYLTPDSEDLIDRKEALRDLGIQMSDTGKFSNHVESVCSRVRQKCGWILRTFNSQNTFFMKFMWKSLVQA